MANNECIQLLKDGVYAKHITTQTADKTVDYKSYFSSEEFKKDFKDGKVNVGVGITVKGVPLKLDYGSSDTQINEFQKTVRESVDFKITDNFFLNNAETFADNSLIEGYNECMKINQLGFDIWHEKTSDEITFSVKYSNLGGLPNPVLESVYFLGKIPINRTLDDGAELGNNATYSFTYKIEQSLKDGTFIIDTNLSTQSLNVNLRKKGGTNNDSPIGTIITSYLNWDRFQIATDNNSEAGPFWKSEYSFWSPCDGRKVPKSAFEDLTSDSNVPDLRGVFLRGLNIFDAYELHNGVAVVSESQKDPDSNRTVGSWQADELRSHPHTTSLYGSTGGGNNFADPLKIASTDNVLRFTNAKTVDAFGGLETRPKNKAVFYYIRIN